MNESLPSRTPDAELERLLKLLRAPAPRVVSNNITKAAMSPIATILTILGFILSIVFLVQGIVMGLVFGRAVVMLFLVPIQCPLLAMLAWGIWSRRRTARLLSEGTLCKGRVITVSPMPARINGRTFFRVRVEARRGAAATAADTVTATDSVDNWAVEYFLNARDRQEDVDVLYADNMPHTVILPAKLAFTRRFD